MKPHTPDTLPINDINWEPLIPLIGASNRALAQYDGILYAVPNPEVLLSPLTTQEAVLSSRIEGTQATLGEVLRFEAGDPTEPERRDDYREILNYRRALRHAETAIETKPFGINLLLELHAILLDSVRGRDKGRGRFRTVQNWIGTPGTPIEEADYVPPDPLKVGAAMAAWETYYHIEQPDPLAQLAVVHAQFEVIHPFLDGNGRIGRILVPLFLHEQKILSRPMFYLSEYLEQHRDEYVARLRALGAKPSSWNDWVAFFLNALVQQAYRNTTKARAIVGLYHQSKERVIALTRSQYAVPLLDRIFEHPVFWTTAVKLAGDHSPTRQSIAAMLRVLIEDGFLKVIRAGRGRRPGLLVFPELMNLCEGSDVY